jgi:uncharacterized membrane protein
MSSPTTRHATRRRTARLAAAALVAGATTTALAAGSALASAAYACALAGSNTCTAPLTSSVHGDVTVTSDGYGFNLSGSGAPGYVEVPNSAQIDTSHFPVTMSVQVKGVGVPSTRVGDYDVVRGTPSGSWKIEVVARKQRTTALATCFFKGPKGKSFVTGGPDLSTMKASWTTIACTNTGSVLELRVNGTLVKSKVLATGPISNPGPLLIGAKDTTGGDQFTGYARYVRITVP